MIDEIRGLNVWDANGEYELWDFIIVPEFWENPEYFKETCIEAEKRWYESDTAEPMCDYISNVLDDAGIDHDVYCRYVKE